MLKFHYIPHSKLLKYTAKDRISMILKLIGENHIVIIEGRLKSTEEASLIRETMSMVGNDLNFHGIEFAVFYNLESTGLFHNLRSRIARLLVGNTQGLTIIGPASIIKELRQHPDHIELHFQKGLFDSKFK